jgi:NADH:ubiquinone oxidoreductase subunit 3 (subunit A)
MLNGLVYFFNYIDVFIYLLTVLGLVILMLCAARLLSPRNYDFEKLSVYECGFETFVTTRIQFNITFVAIAVLYLIFDLEIILLIPWVFFANICFSFSFNIVLFFFFIILLGFIYEWLAGSLNWIS